MYRNRDLMRVLDQTRKETDMKKISLNDIDKSRNNDNGEYQLDPTEKYVINLEEELQFQTAIMTSFQIMGAPPALKNYHAWLFKNNFSCNCYFMVVLQGCKPVICSYDYSSYFICDSDSMACCGDHRSGRCCMFYIAVYNWLDIELEFDITKLSCRMFG